MSTFRTRIRW